MTGDTDARWSIDNVKLYLMKIFHVVQVFMSLFTKLAQPAKIILSEASSPISIPAAEQSKKTFVY